MTVERYYTARRDPGVETILRQALPRLTEAVVALDLPGFAGLALGGGYGRGEGGAIDGRPSNDLDFFVFSDLPEGRHAATIAALEPVSRAFTSELGVDVDFTVRTAARIHLDRQRLMVQELLRGHEVLTPSGFDLAAWADVTELPAEDVPVSEAARLVMNRGMGLVLAAARLRAGVSSEEDLQFVTRNINKAILGAGDARLVVSRRYAWDVRKRADLLDSAAYRAAVEWKFAPTRIPLENLPARWTAARCEIVAALEAMETERRKDVNERTLYQMLRWFRRRGTFGDCANWGIDCTVRVARRVATWLKDSAAEQKDAPQALFEDWHVFN